MSLQPLPYEPYDTSTDIPNVVVDGSPNPATVLTLSHWPALPQPRGLAADLSAQMAFRYLCTPGSHDGRAEVVTNNHFDQDGLVSAYALSRPEDALARRTLLEDVAAAGDFATYGDRRAARLSMLISAFADAERSPLAPLPEDYAERTAHLYTELLGRLPELVDRLDEHCDLWGEEDRQLAESEAALADGDVTITEHPAVDLAVVTLRPTTPRWSGHRFAGRRFDGIHPMALHNATDRFALLLIQGSRYRFTYRYETWVQYQSRRPRPRVDLAGLAEQLTSIETGNTIWRTDPVDDLTPQLHPMDDVESSIAPREVISLVLHHLRATPPIWNPFAVPDGMRA